MTHILTKYEQMISAKMLSHVKSVLFNGSTRTSALNGKANNNNNNGNRKNYK